jgi:hypothetical protein
MGYSITADLMTVNKRRMLMGLSDFVNRKKKKRKEKKRKTEPRFCRGKKYACGQHSKRRSSVHSETFFCCNKSSSQ